MELVENQTFRGETVTVDNTQFKKCIFENTSLVYGGGPLPAFIDCQFKGVSLQFSDAAANTLKFLSGLRKGGFAPAIDKIFKAIRENRY